MRRVDCIIGGAVFCGSFFIVLWLTEPKAPQRLEDQGVSYYNDLPTATQNAGLARNREQQRGYERIDEIFAQLQPKRTPKNSKAERRRAGGKGELAKKHHPDEGGSIQPLDALALELMITAPTRKAPTTD
jgi:hypothetical protein